MFETPLTEANSGEADTCGCEFPSISVTSVIHIHIRNWRGTRKGPEKLGRKVLTFREETLIKKGNLGLGLFPRRPSFLTEPRFTFIILNHGATVELAIVYCYTLLTGNFLCVNWLSINNKFTLSSYK